MATLTNLAPLTAYAFLEKLGEGTSGEVWKVQHENGHIYALKRFKPGCGELVSDEFEQMKKINHPAIVKEYEIGQIDGAPCLVMEYIEGLSLEKARVEDYSQAEIHQIVLQIASGLRQAHDQKIIHRDLKPANIILTHDKYVKILDFGNAASLSYNPYEKIKGNSPLKFSYKRTAYHEYLPSMAALWGDRIWFEFVEENK